MLISGLLSEQLVLSAVDQTNQPNNQKTLVLGMSSTSVRQRYSEDKNYISSRLVVQSIGDFMRKSLFGDFRCGELGSHAKQ